MDADHHAEGAGAAPPDPPIGAGGNGAAPVLDDAASLFEELRGLAADERARRLDARRPAAPELVALVEELLAGHDAEEGKPSSRFDGVDPEAALDALGAVRAGRVGAYELLRPLGEGGMGEVHLARRTDADYDKEVALKVLRRSVNSEGLLRRFRAERRILATLDHPGIATLLDGGTTEDGVAYLVVEYVDGVDLLTYADEKALGVEARVRLFLRIAEAVAYLHRRLVVHRDLKPSNILVTSDGAPRLLDFGVAKILEEDAEEAVLAGEGPLTAPGAAIYTPEYASPEQVRGEEISTQSDVYSLGVLLYELLSGQRPYAFQTRRPSEFEEVVCNERPLALSDVPGADRRRLAGDLETIAAKALRKEPERRYAGVTELAADLRRHLDGFPVLARGDSFGYRTSRYVRRHAWKLAVAGVLLVSAVAFAVQVTLQNARIRTERDRASFEGEVSGEVSEFLVGLFRLADPTETAGEVVTAEMLLSRGTSEIRASVGSSPAVRAALLNSMGWAWKGLGEYARAREVLEDALDAAEPGSEDAGEVLGRLALVELKLGDYDASRAHLEASLAVAEARADGPSAAVARAESGFSELEYDLGRPDVALDHARRALEILEELHGLLDEQPHPAVASAASQLASIQELRGSFEESETLWSEVIAALRELHDGAHVDVANAQLNRSYLYRAMGRMEDARTSVLEAKEMLEEVYGPAHPDLDSAIAQLAGIATDTGDYDEAERIYTDLLERDRAAYGDHLLTSLNLNDLAGIASRKGQLDRAEEFYRAAYDMQRRVLPENHLELGTSASNLGTVLRRMRRYDEAQAYVEESLEIRRANLPPTHPNVLTSLNTLAVIFGDKQDYDRALELAEEVLDARRQKLGEHVQTAGSLYTCAHLALKSGRVDDSLEFAAESVAIFDRVAEGTNIFSASASLFLGDNLAKVGRADEGLPHLRDAARIRTELMGEEAMDAIYARLRLGEVLSEDPATAAEGRALVEAEAARAREVLGDGHPLTKRAARSLEDIRDPKG